MTDIKYTCCPGCHGWYQEGSTHTCDFLPVYGDRAASTHFALRAVPDFFELISQLTRIANALERIANK